jgi:hypothetical protein
VGEHLDLESTLHSLRGTKSNIAIVNGVYKMKYILVEMILLKKYENAEWEREIKKNALNIHLLLTKVSFIAARTIGWWLPRCSIKIGTNLYLRSCFPPSLVTREHHI